MANPPHASATAKDQQASFSASRNDGRGEGSFAREAMRADGLTALDKREDDANGEAAAIFERAAARLRPSWAGADELPAVPGVPATMATSERVELPPSATARGSFAPISTPAAYAALAPSPAPSAFPPGSFTPSYDDARNEDTDGFAASRATRNWFTGGRLAVVAAIGCVALGGLWAALSRDPAPASAATIAPTVTTREAPTPAAVAPTVAVEPAAPAAAPVEIAPEPAAVAAPAPVVAAPVARELTREEAAALLGLPPPAKTVQKPAAKKPAAKPALAKQIAAKAPVKAAAKAPAKAPSKAAAKPAAKAPAKSPARPSKSFIPDNPF